MTSVLTRSRSAAGAAIVEMALVLPVLVAVFVGTADFARVFYYSIELTNAARAGAQYAAHNSAQATRTADIIAAARSAAPNISTATDPIDVILSTPPPVCQCAPNDGTGQPWPVAACPTICTAGNHLVEAITVETRKIFTPFSRFPGIPTNIPLSRRATMRVAL
jgi:Flp pilus assembly protein TadG